MFAVYTYKFPDRYNKKLYKTKSGAQRIAQSMRKQGYICLIRQERQEANNKEKR